MARLWELWALAVTAWIVFQIPTNVYGTEFILCAIVYQGVEKCANFESNQLLGMSVYTDGRPQNVFECAGRPTTEECTKSLTSDGYACFWATVPQKYVKTFGEGYCTLQVLDVAGRDFVELFYYNHVEEALKKKQQLFVPPVEGGRCMALSTSKCEKSLKCSPCRVQRDFYNINATQSDTVCLHKSLLSDTQPELDWCARFQKPFILESGSTFDSRKFRELGVVYYAVDPVPPKFKNDSSYVRMYPLPEEEDEEETEEEEGDGGGPLVGPGDGSKQTSSSTTVSPSRSSSSASSENAAPSSNTQKIETKPSESRNKNGTPDSAALLVETEETDDEGAWSEPGSGTSQASKTGSGWTLKALPIIACSSAVIITLLAIPVYFSLSPLKRSQRPPSAEREGSRPSI